MKLPNHERAYVPEAKITNYLLNEDHPVGASKARFFLRFGFTKEAWQIFASALAEHAAAHEVSQILTAEDGVRYAVEGDLRTPDGRNPYIRSTWIIETGSELPRLTSAYPIDKEMPNETD
jgi:hypothetical protein